MNKITKYLSITLGIALFAGIASCVKDRGNGTDFSNLQPLLEIRDNIPGKGNDAGLANFARASLSFVSSEPDTLEFYVNIASVYALGSDLTVTVAVDDATLAEYNADVTHLIKYEKMPDSTYSLLNNSVVIKAGERVGLISVVFFPAKIEASGIYMLPITIQDAEGVNISENFGTIYYHIIGNCLAGTYDDDGYRKYYTGTIAGGVLLGTLTVPSPKIVSAINPTSVAIDYADLGGSGWQYVVTYDCINTSSFKVDANATMKAGISAGSFKVLGTPTYDPATKTMHIMSQYTNTLGNERLVEETLQKQ